jgi:hypothetical protein
MANSQSCLRRENAYTPGLIESYCAFCGLLVAASPNKVFLQVAETAHICPVYLHYPQPALRKEPQSAKRSSPQKRKREES